MSSVDEILAQLAEVAKKISGGTLREVELNPVVLDVIKELGTRAGVELSITDPDLTIDPTTRLFIYRGQHILLFIPDHSFSFEEVLSGEKEGNKYHLMHCKTIHNMMRMGRYQRYRGTNNTEGTFEIFGKDKTQQAEVSLKVCKNCLSELNYKDYGKNKAEVYRDFNLDEFFKHYQTAFTRMPEDVGQSLPGYPQGWKDISKRYRQSVNWRCEQCGLDLTQHHGLLDVHHMNGVKHDCSPSNLQALCKECHAKQAMHRHYRPLEEMRDCQSLRSLREWQQDQACARKNSES